MAGAAAIAWGAAFFAGAAAAVAVVDRQAFSRSPLTPGALAMLAVGALAGAAVGVRTGDWIAAGLVGGGLTAALSIARNDLEQGRIADLSTAVLGAAGLGFAFTRLGPADPLGAFLGMTLSAALIGLAALIVRVRRGAPGLGAGDVLLCAACGAWTGVWPVGPALLIAALATAGWALARRTPLEARIPFAPGLLTGYGAMTVYEGLA